MPFVGKVFAMRKKICKWWFGTLGVLLVGIQFIPVDRSNPQVTGEIEAPEKIMAILRRSCYDCHSNETKWPWYSSLAPASLLVARDVHDGRKHLNFSEWANYNPKEKKHKQEECGEMVATGEMPLWFYLPLHSEATLSDEEIELLVTWSGLKE